MCNVKYVNVYIDRSGNLVLGKNMYDKPTHDQFAPMEQWYTGFVPMKFHHIAEVRELEVRARPTENVSLRRPKILKTVWSHEEDKLLVQTKCPTCGAETGLWDARLRYNRCNWCGTVTEVASFYGQPVTE